MMMPPNKRLITKDNNNNNFIVGTPHKVEVGATTTITNSNNIGSSGAGVDGFPRHIKSSNSNSLNSLLAPLKSNNNNNSNSNSNSSTTNDSHSERGVASAVHPSVAMSTTETSTVVPPVSSANNSKGKQRASMADKHTSFNHTKHQELHSIINLRPRPRSMSVSLKLLNDTLGSGARTSNHFRSRYIATANNAEGMLTEDEACDDEPYEEDENYAEDDGEFECNITNSANNSTNNSNGKGEADAATALVGVGSKRILLPELKFNPHRFRFLSHESNSNNDNKNHDHNISSNSWRSTEIRDNIGSGSINSSFHQTASYAAAQFQSVSFSLYSRQAHHHPAAKQHRRHQHQHQRQAHHQSQTQVQQQLVQHQMHVQIPALDSNGITALSLNSARLSSITTLQPEEDGGNFDSTIPFAQASTRFQTRTPMNTLTRKYNNNNNNNTNHIAPKMSSSSSSGEQHIPTSFVVPLPLRERPTAMLVPMTSPHTAKSSRKSSPRSRRGSLLDLKHRNELVDPINDTKLETSRNNNKITNKNVHFEEPPRHSTSSRSPITVGVTPQQIIEIADNDNDNDNNNDDETTSDEKDNNYDEDDEPLIIDDDDDDDISSAMLEDELDDSYADDIIASSTSVSDEDDEDEDYDDDRDEVADGDDGNNNDREENTDTDFAITSDEGEAITTDYNKGTTETEEDNDNDDDDDDDDEHITFDFEYKSFRISKFKEPTIITTTATTPLLAHQPTHQKQRQQVVDLPSSKPSRDQQQQQQLRKGRSFPQSRNNNASPDHTHHQRRHFHSYPSHLQLAAAQSLQVHSYAPSSSDRGTPTRMSRRRSGKDEYDTTNDADGMSKPAPKKKKKKITTTNGISSSTNSNNITGGGHGSSSSSKRRSAIQGQQQQQQQESAAVKKSANDSKKTKKKKKKIKTGVFRVFPLNEKEERERFLRGEITVPHFIYRNEASCLLTLKPYATPHTGYMNEAIRILEKVKETYGSESAYLEQINGPLLSTKKSINFFKQYFRIHGLINSNHSKRHKKHKKRHNGNYCTIKLSSALASATCVSGNTLIIRVPANYHLYRLQGVANHEIGTHMLRNLNDRRQVWHSAKQRAKYELKHHLETEEGLACLNTYIHSPCKLLWRAALHYYSCVMAHYLSFAELYKDLEKFVDDPERRWVECLRVKRGYADQSSPGSFCKDQVYLMGAIAILRERRNIDWQLLYSGKICLEDMPKVKEVADLTNVLMPFFIRDDLDAYMRELDEIERINELASG